MLNFPKVTMFSDSHLEKAFEQLDSPTFKLFVYLYQQAHCYEDWGCGFDSSSALELAHALKLNEMALLAGFLTLRKMQWLDAFSARYAHYGEDSQKLEFRWRMYLNEDYKVSAQYYVEQEGPEKEGGYIAIGADRVKPQKRPGRSTRDAEVVGRNKHWHMIRKEVLERDGYKCQECNASKNLHVHHLNYENKGNEKLEDLVTLCRSCHSKKCRKKGGGM